MTQIKLCGLSRMADIEIVNELRPEYIGFVFWEKSSRFISRDEALKLRTALLPNIKAVGVFVDEDVSKVAALLKDGIIDVAQLHGHEDSSYVERLRNLSPGSEIIKALKVRDKESFLKGLDGFALAGPDFFLLDSGTGSGQTFNWEVLKSPEVRSKLKEASKGWFLAGGLDPDNVTLAVKELRPMAVDVSSGIETEGKKDPGKMRAFVKAVRDLKCDSL
ncbi:MAG: phosphoribosylanthranilate isomerase [Butyrivibrio sp.]|nr:phosphoribosylanthranilate isomerase [Butyrivibrio sp.]